MRGQEYGPNELSHKAASKEDENRTGFIGRFWEEHGELISGYFEQFQDPLIMLLMGSAIVSLLLGQLENAISIGLAVLLVGTVGFVQEWRSEKSLEALNRLAPPRCRVIRGGTVLERLASELVPGDLVELELGDRVPADLLLVSAVGLEADESMMTGEQAGRCKRAIPARTWPSRETENEHRAFMGTLVRAGRGKGVVVATGAETELGRLFRLVEQTEDRKSPLQLSLDSLGHQLTLYSGIVIAIISVIGLLQGRPLMELFTVAVSLAVAAIPEGLPVVATVTLALGVLRLARRQVIVRKLPAVEALGAVTILCADKTGTLTTNALSVQCLALDDGALIEADALSASQGDEALTVMTICNNAVRHDGKWLGNAVDAALMSFAESKGRISNSQWRRLAEQPFSSDTKYMLVEAESTALGRQIFVKGAGEMVAGQLTLPDDRSKLLRFSEALHARGLRTLALASGPTPDRLKLVGALGLADPPRPGIDKTLSALRSAHLRIVMVTGDAKETAASLAATTGFSLNPNHIVSGEELGRLLSPTADPILREQLLNSVSIVYRALPHHKLLLVQAMQTQLGAVVAMTGDGVNDAPALKMADIGIAMGRSGTDVAREAAKLILTDDNLGALLDGVHEGKAIFANIRHFIRFQLATSLAALGLIALSSLVPGSRGAPPLNPMQILLINIIMDGPPAQCLGVEPIHPDVLSRPPRHRDTPILTHTLLIRTALSALFVLLGCLAVFAWECQVAPGDSSRTFTAFVLFSLVNAFSCRSLDRSVLSLGLTRNKPLNISIGVALATLAAILYTPFFSRVFQTTALSFTELAGVLALSSMLLAFDEAIKMMNSDTKSPSRKGYIPLFSK